MAGFVTGLAVFVAVGQLNKLFGVEKPDGNTVERLVGIIRELPEASIAASVVGLVALALLFVVPRIDRRLPGGLSRPVRVDRRQQPARPVGSLRRRDRGRAAPTRPAPAGASGAADHRLG